MSRVRAINLSPERLTLTWADGESTIEAAALRRSCRCAPCQSAHLRGASVPVDEDVRLVDARPVGHYALQLVFSDGHDRGIYPWSLLSELSPRPVVS